MDRTAAALLTLLVSGTASAASTSAQSIAERAFERARDWTVYIRTSVDRPFIEDNQGSLSGSGLVVDAKRGWILTNAHVASHSYSSIQIAFHDGGPVPAQRVYVDPYIDVAILAYDPAALPTTPPEPKLGCQDIPQVGHPVGAYGHPWGFRFTGTRGIASAVTSRLGPDMLQTDAPINAGNSGGPLISLENGTVVGLNTASMRKDQAEGLSFAVPMPFVCRILGLLKQNRDPSPPARAVDFAIEENDERTLIVAASDLAAGSLDIRVGDEILAAGSPPRAVSTEAELVDQLRGHLDEVVLTVRRDDAKVVIRGSWPASPRIVERQALWISGAMFGAANPLLVSQVRDAPALMVHHVEPGSDAGGAEFHAYDFLVNADGRKVRTLADLETIAQQAASDQRPLSLMLLRLVSDADEGLFLYQQRMLDAADIQHIGAPDAQVASVIANEHKTH